jgi:hypothetical protein
MKRRSATPAEGVLRGVLGLMPIAEDEAGQSIGAVQLTVGKTEKPIRRLTPSGQLRLQCNRFVAGSGKHHTHQDE